MPHFSCSQNNGQFHQNPGWEGKLLIKDIDMVLLFIIFLFIYFSFLYFSSFTFNEIPDYMRRTKGVE